MTDNKNYTNLTAMISNASPSYQLLAGDKPVGDALQSRLRSLTLYLYEGEQSDQLVIVLDDGPHQQSQRLVVPRTGKKLSLCLGDTEKQGHMGIYHVETVSVGSDNGRTLTITAVPKLLLKETTRTWANTTLGDIIMSIAADHDLKPKISRSLSVLNIEAENQCSESDIQFLTRLAKRYGAMVKPAGESLLFLDKGKSATASGIPLVPVLINPDDILNWDGHISSDRTAYGRVIAAWHDRVNAIQVQVEVGDKRNQETFYMPHLYASADQAKRAAQARYEDLNRDTASLRLEVLGKPGIIAGGAIAIMGVHRDMAGTWLVKSVTHTLDSNGYLSSLQCYKAA